MKVLHKPATFSILEIEFIAKGDSDLTIKSCRKQNKTKSINLF